MNLHINLLSVNERMNSTYVKLVKDDFTENRWSKRQSGINNLCEVILNHRFSQSVWLKTLHVRNNRSNDNQIKASRACWNRLWTVFYLCMIKSSLGCNKTQPVVQFDEGTSKTFFPSVRELIHEWRTKAAVMAEHTWRCAAAISTALILIL